MHFEEILSKVGGFGRFQKLVVLLLGLAALMRSSHVYVQLFIATEPPHYCQVWKDEDCAELNVTTTADCMSLKKQLSIPSITSANNETVFEQCVQYNLTDISLKTAVENYDQVVKYLEVIPCTDGWIFSESTFYPSSIIADFELVCGSAYLMEVAQSVFFAGSLLSCPIFGLTADIYGRRIIMLVSFVATILFGFGIAFSSSIWMYMVLRFLISAFLKGIGLMALVMSTEMVIPSKRLLVSNAMYIWWGIGYIALAGLAKLFTRWRILQAVITLPYIPIFVFVWMFVPESPRWLISTRKTEIAKKVLKEIARMNRKILSEDEISTSCKPDKSNDRVETKSVFKDFIHSPLVLTVFANMLFSCCIQCIVYYGLTFTSSSLGVDPYLSFVLSGLSEIPAFIICAYVGEKIGRRWTNFGAMITSGLCCCAISVIPLGIPRLIASMTGKFFISMSLSALFTWIAEIMPTSLRSSTMGIFQLSSRLGGVLTPLIIILKDVWEPLPILVIGVLAVLSSLFCLCLPETKGKPLPSTIQDTEQLFKRKLKVANESKDGTYSPLSTKEDKKVVAEDA